MLRYPNVLLFSSDETEANSLQRILGKHVISYASQQPLGARLFA